MMEIPVISLTSLGKGNPSVEEITAIGKACLEFGFFHVVDHGIEEELRQQVLEKL